jgi:hypothetical protein
MKKSRGRKISGDLLFKYRIVNKVSDNLEEPAGVVPSVLLHVGHTVLQDLPDRVPPAHAVGVHYWCCYGKATRSRMTTLSFSSDKSNAHFEPLVNSATT